MKLHFGRHAGKTLEDLMIKEPGYIAWLLDQPATRSLAAAQQHARGLVGTFNAAPLRKTCQASDCNERATYCTVYADSLLPYWWCDDCDPYQTGANSGKLQAIRDYRAALVHVALYCNSRKTDQRAMIGHLAQAKGLVKPITAQKLSDFFG